MPPSAAVQCVFLPCSPTPCKNMSHPTQAIQAHLDEIDNRERDRKEQEQLYIKQQCDRWRALFQRDLGPWISNWEFTKADPIARLTLDIPRGRFGVHLKRHPHLSTGKVKYSFWVSTWDRQLFYAEDINPERIRECDVLKAIAFAISGREQEARRFLS